MKNMVLSKNHFMDMLHRNELPVKELRSEKQIQPNGLELTLESVHSFDGAGCMAEVRTLPTTTELAFDENNQIHLSKGSYKVVFTETVHIPKNAFALARPRSSLLRMGAMLGTALWDSGYVGRSEAILVVENSHGLTIEKGVRMLQLVFFQLDEAVKESYDGAYQGENLENKENQS